MYKITMSNILDEILSVSFFNQLRPKIERYYELSYDNLNFFLHFQLTVESQILHEMTMNDKNHKNDAKVKFSLATVTAIP